MSNEGRAHWLDEYEVVSLGDPIAFDQKSPNPVIRYESGWYFWDECWVTAKGPYESMEKANKACAEYASTL
jgi:hypothetical protein